MPAILSMAQKYFRGLLILSLLFLSFRILKKKRTKVANVPSDFLNALWKTLKGTAYQNRLDNWAALAKMETAGFSSNIYKRYNNPWGMRRSVQRKNKQSGSVQTSNGVFATYNSLQDAADDILLWMTAQNFPVDSDTETPSLSTFVANVGARGYYGSEPTNSYLQKVIAWEQR